MGWRKKSTYFLADIFFNAVRPRESVRKKSKIKRPLFHQMSAKVKEVPRIVQKSVIFTPSLMYHKVVATCKYVCYVAAKKSIDQDIPWLMRQYCALHWEEIMTKILFLWIRPVCFLFSQKTIIQSGVP